MILTGPCLKCSETVRLDIGEQTKQQAIDQLSALDFFECTVGHHAELGSPYPFFWEIDTWEPEGEQAERRQS